MEITRREALARGGQAVAATPPDSGDVSPCGDPDAELIALGRQLEEARANGEKLSKELDPLKGTAEFGKASDLESAAWERHAEIEEQIGATPATTIDGIIIKLRIVATSVPLQGPYNVYETNIKSALADAERLAGHGRAI